MGNLCNGCCNERNDEQGTQISCLQVINTSDKMLSSEVRLGRKVDRPLWHNDLEPHSTEERIVSILETDLN